MKGFCFSSKLIIFIAVFAAFSCVGINVSSQDSEMVIAAIQEPPPSPPVDPDPPPPPPDPFTTV